MIGHSRTGPMRLQDIELLLQEAARISNHRAFVIVGSLSAIGAVVTPPPEMVQSLDVDLFPKLDPGRGFAEIAAQLGENSAFDKAHGFFADPISPVVLTLPDEWQQRLIPISLAGGLVAYFLDPVDAAISKLARSEENDLRWVRAGLREGILQLDMVRARGWHLAGASSEEQERIRHSIERLSAEVTLSTSITPSTLI